MPKSKGVKFYAVAAGRNAPRIYETWAECEASVARFPNAMHKSFRTREEAEQWLKSSKALSAVLRSDELMPSTHNDARTVKPPEAQRRKSPKPESNEPQVKLSPEQMEIYAKVKAGSNVFFTGAAGTGKSVLLREIIRLKRVSCLNKGVAVTASTGLAALNIDGTTLHSWAGIKLGDEEVDKFIDKVRYQRKLKMLRKRWLQVQTLIIDEISMIDGSLFDYLEKIARGLRNSHLPFGGIQLVLCGDFCQLPPVPNRDPNGRCIPTKFTFEADSWSACIGAPMVLKQVFRQKDQAFADMLNQMRYGEMQDSTIQTFQALSRMVMYTDGIEPTELYPTRKEVADANAWRLARLPGASITYEAQDCRGVDHLHRPITGERMVDILKRLVAPSTLVLKVGAQVMLIKNLQQGVLVNGSVGQVVDFKTPSEATKACIEIAQVESVKNIDQLDEDGSGRKREVPRSERIAQEILQRQWKWPVVRFINGRTLMVIPVEFDVTNGDGETMMARRLQLPLILAWALSVHKAQGQTLERVCVDLRRTFEKGQAYVALSRATTKEHLQVLGFSEDKVMVHPKVVAWYAQNAGSGEKPACPNSEYEFDELSSFNERHG